MALHPDEQRLARSLRELVLEFENGAEDLEIRLGWEDDRLSLLLDGRKGWTVEEVFEVLAVLRVAPSEFFDALYEVNGKPSVEAAMSEVLLRNGDPEAFAGGIDIRFEESQRVVIEAVRRRDTWKREKTEN